MHDAIRPTIRDVARAAGVSPTTVSHTLNGKGTVRKETAERIRAEAARIGYRPNAIARGLRSSRMGLIGLVIRPFAALDSFIPTGVDYFLRIAGFGALAAMEYGYSLMIVDDLTKENSPISALAADAYIVTEPYGNDPVVTMLERKGIPFVLIGADIARRDRFVTMDTLPMQQTRQMLEHLVDAGGTRLALVTGTDENAWNQDSRAAYLEWCEERGDEPLWIAMPEVEGEHAGEAIFERFFGEGAVDRPDAVYCLLGRQASGLVAAAVRRGVDVPGELLVAAGSGSLQNQTASPTVTALDLQPELIAQRAVEAAIALVEGRPVERDLRAPDGVLHVRDSTSR